MLPIEMSIVPIVRKHISQMSIMHSINVKKEHLHRKGMLSAKRETHSLNM